jgi:tetratricopeptide (TPR) repeat protein
MSSFRTTILLSAALAAPWSNIAAQTARISEETRVITTYPFSEPNPIPILTRDARLYPYHSFEGYAKDGVPREWKVVRLENDFIEVFVLPEAGGKVWGAIVKRTGHEFIYRNEVMKFRNIALRGPWTSGGIEFNFGVIGHTPSTATPVDYVLRENWDGSVSCIVGTMDLPSRTHWRVEIRLPDDRAYFETKVLWYNPTPLEQPYYNWMTAAAFARDDLEMSIPGNAFLAHSGASRTWPVDTAGRYLPAYDNNRFAGHKSYHVVGELNDFFGGYYHDDDYGFGHWSRYEEMPGQKLWLWALSREGGVWEELLTDTDGQYIEFQAGRLFVQYSPGADVNPITQVGFEPGAADSWSETWFPLEGIGGLTDASREGAMHVSAENGTITVSVNAFGNVTDTLRVSSGDRLLASHPVTFSALEPVEFVVNLEGETTFRVELPLLGLDYMSDPSARELARPFATDPAARLQIPLADRLAFEARELVKGRRYGEARARFESALAEEPWNHDALLGLADLEYRRGLYGVGLRHVTRVLQLDAYDAQANFVAGNLYRALGRVTDAREAYGWAARSTAYRSVAYVQLAELALAGEDYQDAIRYGSLALDYHSYSLPAWQVLSLASRKAEISDIDESIRRQMFETDRLHHFGFAEAYVANPETAAATFVTESLRSEYPDQTILELAVDYVRRGADEDARAILDLGTSLTANPLLHAWMAWLNDDPSQLPRELDLNFVFPYRRETIAVLEWAVQHDEHWSWAYLLALNLWARDRADEAASLLEGLGETPDFAPLYMSRAHLLQQVLERDPEADLRRAVELDRSNRTIRIHLIRYLQSQQRWEDALAESDAGRALFPDDFNLDLLQVRSLNQLGRAREALDILNATHVLPSENARESHRSYERAHTLAALDAIDGGAYDEAQRHLRTALEWPEHLGQGRPYEPEERLVQYLLGQVEQRLGEPDRARAALEAVVDATGLVGANADRLDLLAVPSLAALRRSDELSVMWSDTETDVGRLGSEMIRILETGGDLSQISARLAAEHSALFDDLLGRMLVRALTLGVEDDRDRPDRPSHSLQ